MAKTAMVKLTSDSDWQEVEIANFYDPTKHHTVRLDGSTKKVKYHRMKMEDGRIYNKQLNKWEAIVADTKEVVLDGTTKLPLPYKDNSVKNIKLVQALERCDSVVDLIKECYRVLIPNGKITSLIPLAPCHSAFSDPETKNYFNEATLHHFHKNCRYGLFSNYTSAVRGESLDITLKK